MQNKYIKVINVLIIVIIISSFGLLIGKLENDVKALKAENTIIKSELKNIKNATYDKDIKNLKDKVEDNNNKITKILKIVGVKPTDF